MPPHDLIATASFTYKTRRLKAGEGFQAKNAADARVLMAIKKAREGRVPGKVAPPPRPIAEKIEERAAPVVEASVEPAAELREEPVKETPKPVATTARRTPRKRPTSKKRG